MDLKKTKLQKFSLENVEWGSPEFYKIHEKLKKQQEELKEYEQVKAVKTIQGEY
ncbi:hypothetical protein [Oceanobacillus alkalisoli]|uniref:hypothetical protein n=1 Tax=Oceanobacillus alkalisoli TaxID=2925113 RepID=UPI001EE40E34|nr:hypothetical protein [Oceanobacillus alkalisoli]MCG5104667.1 hypothetical protein [Oceanobacillus alkalisoli]